MNAEMPKRACRAKLRLSLDHVFEAVFLMAEVTLAGEHHWDAVLVASVNDFLVSHTAARLDDRGNACLGRELDRISKREESI